MFKRPLDKTRITDFFGGVAQVEVVDPADCMPDTLVSDSPAIEIEVTKAPMHHSLPPLSFHATTAMSGFFTWLREWRVVRVWVSVGLIGVLVGWVVCLKR